MKGLCVYIKAGKGHYVPAEAVDSALKRDGVDSRLIDFFSYLDLEFLEKVNQGIWRLMLKIPFLEKHLFSNLDNSKWGIGFLVRIVYFLRKRKLKKNLCIFRPDFIFATHPYPGTILSSILNKLGEDIPVYFYSTDVFSSPRVAICPYLRKFYLPTVEGIERTRKMGQKEDTLALCPFPLQDSVAKVPRLDKKEARKKIDIEEMFTIQLNLGGEGLGSLALLEAILKEDLPVQVVIIGGIRDAMRSSLENLIARYPRSKVRIRIRGFVKNVSEYLAASDVIVGRAGINTIVEAIYAHRPFLITELVYIVIASAEYVEKYHVGWNATGDVEKQLGIIKDLVDNPWKLLEMEENFGKVPIEYSSEKLARMITDDVSSLLEKK